MLTGTKQTDAASLVIGMFVSRLDRPWLDTPFLFQGFQIRTKQEISELQRYCDYVFVDFEKSSIDLSGTMRVPPASAQAQKSRWKRRLAGRFPFLKKLSGLFKRKATKITETPTPGHFYEDSVPVKEELIAARSIHGESVDRLTSVLDSIRRGEVVALPELEAVVDPMVDSVLRNSTAMALLVRLRKTDDYTYAHSIGASVWALVFGRHLGLDKESLKALCQGALLLDVGKTKIPTELLQKTGKLTPEETDLVRTHVELGVELVKEIAGIDPRVVSMVATHHERYDGSGYPQGLNGNQVPVFGRIAGILDSYVAMISDRPYAEATSTYNVMREFKSLSDKTFQAEMVEQFIQAIGIFPAGTLVELNTGEVGVVIKEHSFQRLKPEVALILDSNKQPLSEFKIIDLHDSDDETDGTDRTPAVWIERGVEPGAYDIDPSEYFL
ncbi:MAG: HD-GYP domain-containing protein [Gammaproteobacteria bacterium]|nr:HD-GYP domain-containing protein [Gammaproteobacteria bacterium]